MTDFAQSVKQQVDIVKIVEGYIRLRKAGAQNYTGLVPVSQGKVAVVLRACGAAVLPLLWLRRFGRCVHLCGQDRECDVSRGGADRGAEGRHSAAQAGVLVAGRSRRSAAAGEAAGFARGGGRVVSRSSCADRRERWRASIWPAADFRLRESGKFRIGYAPDSFQRAARPAERHGRRGNAARRAGFSAPKEQGDGTHGPALRPVPQARDVSHLQ